MKEYIERAKLMDHIELNAREHEDDYDAWQILGDVEDFPAADVVSRGAFDQVMWERDVAIQQLREDYGVGLGEKKAADVVERKRGEWETPFKNDPFALVWKAFKNLYQDKECEIWWDQHQGDTHDEEYGFTQFPTDGSEPQVFLFAEHGVNIQVETLAHELAHVAVGIEHGHDEIWEAAFDEIFCEYNRIGDELFGGADMMSHQNILCDQTEEGEHEAD